VHIGTDIILSNWWIIEHKSQQRQTLWTIYLPFAAG